MNVPQLRFDGFDGEWKEFSFDQIASITMGQSPSGDSYNTSKQGEPLINGPTEFGDIYPTPVQWTTKPSKFSKPGDTLLCVRGSSIGRMNLSDSRYCIGRGVAAISGLDNKTTSAYMKYVLEKEVEKILKRSTGSTFPNISGHELKQSRISIPNLEEQEKIAKFLTVLDYKREKQQEKIEKLEQFKKGMMQKIFSQELRFKDEDGVEFPEWETTTFHEVANIRRGASPRPIKDPKWFSASSKIGWLRISDVTASGVYLNEVTQYLSEEGIKKSVLLEEPHLILSIAATIGKPVINKIPVCIHDGFIVFKNLKLNMLFGYYYLEHFQDKWLQFRQPGSQFNLNSDLVGNLDIIIPNNKEQQKIANFFSAIDKKLEKEKEKLIALEEQKKGFMQGMFV